MSRACHSERSEGSPERCDFPKASLSPRHRCGREAGEARRAWPAVGKAGDVEIQPGSLPAHRGANAPFRATVRERAPSRHPTRANTPIQRHPGESLSAHRVSPRETPIWTGGSSGQIMQQQSSCALSASPLENSQPSLRIEALRRPDCGALVSLKGGKRS